MVVAGALTAFARRIDEPVDAASLAFFRIAFGLLMVVASIRFFTHGWIEADYRVAKVFFHYWGFAWVRPWPGIGMYVHYAVMGSAALAIAAGFAYRPACIVFALAFTYAHLCDKSNYLNHYYLVSLISILLVFLPLDCEGSLRVFLRPADRRPYARAWMLWLLRFQIGVVYFFGGVAKLGSDWLVHGEPLRIWLAANAEMPILGRFFDRLAVAIGFSVCGALFDLSIVPLLLWKRTRAWAFAAVVIFHVLTSLLFHIGMFPWIMMASATLMFDPSWPRLGRSPERGGIAGPVLPGAGRVVIAIYAVVQLLLPLRHWLYPGNTLWTEEGFRFAWKVMLVEKSGELELTVVDREGRRTLVQPRQYLTPFQMRMAATQPDMILELAHVVRDDFDRRGVGPVSVYADAQVSFNGRRRAPLVSPTVDLAREEDTLAPKRWVLPAPTSAPEF
jgi:vitamin K-dependent gamma-carboxylase